MARRALTDDRAFDDVERRKQGGRFVPDIVMGVNQRRSGALPEASERIENAIMLMEFRSGRGS
jgi:hypothetical protein